jgi:hypothetical protein
MTVCSSISQVEALDAYNTSISAITETFAPFIKRHLAFSHELFSQKSITWGFGKAYKKLLKLESEHCTSILDLKYGIPEKIGSGYLRTRLQLRDVAFLYRGKTVLAVMHMQDLKAYIQVNLNDILAVLRSTPPFSSDRYVIFPDLDSLNDFKSKHSVELEQIRKEFEKPPFVALVHEENDAKLKANDIDHATYFIIVNRRYVIEIDGICSLEGDCHIDGNELRFNEQFMLANFRFRSSDLSFYFQKLSEYLSDKYEKHSLFNNTL